MRIPLPVFLLIIGLLLTSHSGMTQQQLQHESIVINIEVPVRVFKGNTFIDNLTDLIQIKGNFRNKR